MKIIVLTLLNIGLIVFFFYLLKQRNLLSYSHGGKIWLTYLSVGVITLMDEFTSIFYAPAEAYRFIGLSAIIFIAVTSLLIRFISTRLTEIAEILENHQLIGGGVYSFSYLVLGPMVSFVAVSSIMVDYILTACISAVSAVSNATSLYPLSPSVSMTLVLAIIWAVAGLNILGIKENARFTFMIFIGAAFVMLNLIVSGLMGADRSSLHHMALASAESVKQVSTGSILDNYGNLISSIAFCILAYSGVESVLQTAGFVRSWKEIRKAYWFLALTVGIVTPLMAALVLSTRIDFKAHEGDLITHYATLLNGIPFGLAVGALASFTLIMAVNTAFVASSELMERVAHRYGFHWLIATNKRHSLYRIHLASAAFFSIIIFLTSGSQTELANMYALGLLASFCINMGSLIIYRYFRGRADVTYSTSRIGTLILWIILVSCFVFLAIDKHHATVLWATVTGVMLLAGFLIARKRSPELKQIEKAENEMEMILFLAESDDETIHLFFRRSQESDPTKFKHNEVYITFYSPRVGGLPPKNSPNHFRFPLTKISLYHRIVAILKVMEYEMGDRRIVVHFGWPLSSWLERLSIGVMVFNLMRLPRLFPHFDFDIHYFRKPTSAK
ncbi:MAG TPA: amino acid permease [Thermodesulfobacteriota bacterium]|nr:amino acid permease [Thermodesulfobacteriota bacterium]